MLIFDHETIAITRTDGCFERAQSLLATYEGRRFNTIRNTALSLGNYSLLVTKSEPKTHNKRLIGDTFRVAPCEPLASVMHKHKDELRYSAVCLIIRRDLKHLKKARFPSLFV